MVGKVLGAGIYATGYGVASGAHNAPLWSSEGSTLPIVVFSHGLGGFRTIYSHFCRELAAHGYGDPKFRWVGCLACSLHVLSLC